MKNLVKTLLIILVFQIHFSHGQLASLKNINMTGYSKVSIPYLEDHNKTLDVQISIMILNIGNLDTTEMTFEVEMYFDMRWMDPRLAFKSYLNASYVLVSGTSTK